MKKQEIIEKLRKKLFSAIDEHNLKKVKRYVKKARDINKKNEIINGEMDGIRPIHRAVYAYNLKALRFLLHNGADINAISNMCFSPFVYVTTTMNNEIEETVYTNNEIKKIAHDHCGSTSPREMQGFTALHLAFFYCRLDIARILIRNKNIDINIKNMNNETAFDVIGGYYNLSDGNYTMQEILSITANNVTEADCKAKLTSMKADIKLGLGANGNTNSAGSEANLSLSPTKAIKIELEAGNTTDLASSTVNSSFTLTRENFKEASSTASGAVKPSSFINSIFSGITTTISGLFSSAPALPTVQQSVAHSARRPICSSQVDFNGTALLTDVVVKKLAEKKYSRPLNDSFLTIERIRERRANAIKEKFDIAMDKFAQCPESFLVRPTISKGMHQKSF